MPGAKYELYGRPTEPTDPNADVLTVQESAFVLKCSVSHLRRWLRENPKLRTYSGRRLVTNRRVRDAYYRMNQGVRSARIPAQRSAA
ncbi:DNA-binding protein [Streptomyces lunaelactis]|uniref:DNA-binding protein n=1 Tax=Streptomyces lunaelactis TaxID=1535768 RepID=UPI001585CC4F|nr:DNA-binding protein [Streptomyces lunaelactis]NUL13264.1 DNA-binding protein [Streptomyces lunaelactis]